MQIRVKNDEVEVEGYVNAVERNSKPLWSRIGQFIERICKGAFQKALDRNDNIRLLLNHDENRDLGGTKEGNLELHEDSIGLHAHATIRDAEVAKDAREGNLVGWSFGFFDREVEDGKDEETNLPLRKVRDLDMVEVSLLNRQKNPAYEGTLVTVRDDAQPVNLSEANLEEAELRDETEPEPVIDYSEYEKLLDEIRRY